MSHERTERILRPAFLDSADCRIKQKNRKNNRPIGGFSQEKHRHARGEQNVDKRTLELPQENNREAIGPYLRQNVGAVLFQPSRGLVDT